MKIYNDVITIRKEEKEKLVKLLKISKLTKKRIYENRVLKKIKSIYQVSKVRGKYRLRSYRLIYHNCEKGNEPSMVSIKEKNILLTFDLKKVYYDSTYANERHLFCTEMAQKKLKNNIKIDLLYGGIGVLGFNLIRIPLVENVTVIDFNIDCKKWYQESLRLQPKRYQHKIFFVASKVEEYLLRTTNKIGIAVAPLNRIPLKKIMSVYEELYYYILIENSQLLRYLIELSKKYIIISYRKAKEYTQNSFIYLFNLARK